VLTAWGKEIPTPFRLGETAVDTEDVLAKYLSVVPAGNRCVGGNAPSPEARLLERAVEADLMIRRLSFGSLRRSLLALSASDDTIHQLFIKQDLI